MQSALSQGTNLMLEVQNFQQIQPAPSEPINALRLGPADSYPLPPHDATMVGSHLHGILQYAPYAWLNKDLCNGTQVYSQTHNMHSFLTRFAQHAIGRLANTWTRSWAIPHQERILP